MSVLGLQSKERSYTRSYAKFALSQNKKLRLTSLSYNDLPSIHPLPLNINGNGVSPRSSHYAQAHAQLLLQKQIDLLEQECGSAILTPSLLFIVISALVSQFLVGFSTGVMNPPALFVFPGHTTFEWSMAVGAFAIGGPFGAKFAGRIADDYGRKPALTYNFFLFAVGGWFLALAPTIHFLIAARFLIGFASGFSTVLVPIYLGEISPPNLRGRLGTLAQFGVVVGILAADGLGMLFTGENWRYLFGLTFALAFVQIFFILRAPNSLLESPRWLLSNGRQDVKRARNIIRKLRGFRNEYEVDVELGHIVSSSNSNLSDMDSTGAGVDKDKQKQVSERALKIVESGYIM